MITLIEWLSELIGISVTSDNEFIFLLVSAILVVIAFTCALSLFIGIAFAIFKR